MSEPNEKLSTQQDDGCHTNRILLVEPDRLTRWSVHEYLKKCFTILLAEHTDLALQLLADNTIDAIIVANDLPADGANRIEQLAREQNSKLLIVRTTTANARDHQSGQHTVFLEKPFDLYTLEQVLFRHIGSNKTTND